MAHWFATPALLLLVLAFVPLAIWDAMRRWGTVRRRQLLSVVLRCLMLTAVVLAVARPQRTVEESVAEVIFVVDRSASIPDRLLHDAMEQVESLRGELGPDERAGLILFDGQPQVVVHPGGDWQLPEPLRPEAVDETDVSTALQAALGLIPEDHRGRIVLFSDGQSTQGATRGAIDQALARQVQVFTVPIDPGFADPAVADIELDRRTVRPGESIGATVRLRSGPDAVTGRLIARLDGEVIADEAVNLVGGRTLDVPVEHALADSAEPGMARLEVVFEPDPGQADIEPNNNRRAVGIEIGQPPGVLIVAHDVDEVENLGQALSAEQMRVEVRSVADLSDQEPDFDDWDLVILGNVPATETEEGEAFLQTPHIEALRRYVSAGGGLVVLGGDRAYELGGYGNTALTRLLPIDLQPEDPQIEPAVTMIIILDNSGSMGSWAEGGTKMDLANAAAVAAMNLLRSFDQLGVMAVDDRVDWVVPIQQVSDRSRAERSIRGIQAGGGGIYVYTSLREAYRQMRRVDSPLRHVILFSDAADSEEQVSGVIFGWGPGPNSYDLARSMRTEGITVSVIGIGYEYDQDTHFLRTLAEQGGGRFYLTSRASELQSLFVEETQRLVDSALNEQPFRVRSERDHPATQGIEFRRSPRLDGYVELEPRPTAEVILTHPDGHPVMTTWQYGLGHVVALAIDAGPRWSSGWLDWDGYPLFWTQLARWAMRRHEGDETAIEVVFDGTDATLRMARRSQQGLTEVEGGLRAQLTELDEAGVAAGPPRPIALDILEPGLWEATLTTEPGRRYRVEVVDAGGEIFAEQGFVAPPSGEFRREGADRLGLTEMAQRTGGTFDAPADAARGSLATLTRHEPLWLYFLCGAILLMPIDAFLRRSGRDS